MAVSVIVSNFNGAKYLPRLLGTLKTQQNVTMEIIVADRNSTEESETILAQHPDVRVVTEPPESGLVAGYAAGVPHAKSEHLFFCNEDMWFDPDFLRLLESSIDLERRIGAADPWQWSYDGQIWIHGGTRFRPVRLNPGGTFPFCKNEFTSPIGNWCKGSSRLCWSGDAPSQRLYRNWQLGHHVFSRLRRRGYFHAALAAWLGMSYRAERVSLPCSWCFQS